MYPCTYQWKLPANAAQQAASRGDILALQASMFSLNDGASNADMCHLEHHFAPGMYGRQCTLPAGSVVVGKIHRHAHLNVVIKGHAKVATEFGSRDVRAGDVFVSEPGAKRAVYAVEETVWITVHTNPTDTRDLAEIENHVIAPCYEALAFDETRMIANEVLQ